MNEPQVEVIRDSAEHRYVLNVDGQARGAAYYRDDGEHLVFTHTEIDAGLEGQGMGSRLARGALEDARLREKRIVTRCSFMAGYVDRHPQWQDLLASP